MAPSATRGRRPAGSDTKAAIEAAARKRFAAVGYPKTTMRAIAADAGVDPRLITHFFGSKQQLFVSVVELPFDPEPTFAALLADGGEEVGTRLAEFIVGLLENDRTRSTVTGILRAAASEEEAADRVREMVVTRMLIPLARHVGADQPELRAAMIGSQVVGMTFTRHVVGIPALQEADRSVLIGFLSQVFEIYLRGSPKLPPTA